jgi:uncharacterized protein YebE (UPF0316 family)
MNEINWSLTILIFFARILDVTLGTLRIVFISKGKRLLPPLFGFVEVFIWIVVVSHLVQNVSNLLGYLAYAAGFATGTYVGMLIENRLAIGTLIVRATVSGEVEDLVDSLAKAGYGVTSFNAQGATGPVKVINTVINRSELADIVRLMCASHPQVFYTVEEAQMANRGIFHHTQPTKILRKLGLKGKR